MLGFFMPGSDTPWTPAGSAAVAWEDRGGQLGDYGGTEMSSKRFLRKKIVPTILVAGVALAGLRFTSPHAAGERYQTEVVGRGTWARPCGELPDAVAG